MTHSLNGSRILVTRPAHQAEGLCGFIEQRGGVAVRFPTLEIVGIDATKAKPDYPKAAATKSLPELSNFQWLIFTSANAVNFALKAKGGKISEFKAAQIAAIGQATARELMKSGLPIAVMPTSGFDSVALLAMPQLSAVKGQDVLIVRGQGGREELAAGLRNRGAKVDHWEVYRRVIPAIDNAEVIDLLKQDEISAIIITSYEALQNLLDMLGLDYHKKLTIIPLVVISNRIKKLAQELGFTRIAVAENPSDTAVVEAAIAIINGE